MPKYDYYPKITDIRILYAGADSGTWGSSVNKIGIGVRAH
jgi:hypothetical protein